MQIILMILYMILSWCAFVKIQSWLGLISISTFTYRLIFSMILGWLLIPIWLIVETAVALAKRKG